MNNKALDKFSIEMNKPGFVKKLIDKRILLKEVKIYSSGKEDFSFLLIAYPFTKTKLKVFKNLSRNAKLGMLTRHLMGIASRNGVCSLYLDEYRDIKMYDKIYDKEIKSKKWENDWYGNLLPRETAEEIISISNNKAITEEYKRNYNMKLNRMTFNLLQFCLGRYDSRGEILNKLLGGE